MWHTVRIEGMNGLALAHCRTDRCRSAYDRRQPAMTGALDKPTPELLIQAIARCRDRAAFTSLFMRFAPRVKAYLLQRGLDAALAEELAQEALLIVWRKAAQYDPARA